MALAAVLAGDHELEWLRGATPELADAAREASRSLLEGPREDLQRRAAAELASMVNGPGVETVRERWGRAPASLPALPGLRRVVQAHAVPRWPVAMVPAWLSPLSGDGIQGRLVELSATLLRAAATGERWAVVLATRGTAKLGRAVDISPRLTPAVAWVGAAVGADRETLEALAAQWPAGLGAALVASSELSETLGGAELEELRRRLDEVLSRG